jgi:hypothetical protein
MAPFVHGSGSSAIARAQSACAASRWPSSAYALPRLNVAVE